MENQMFNNFAIKGILDANGIGTGLQAALKQLMFDIEHPINSIKVQREGEPTPAQKYGMGTWALDTAHDGRMEIGANITYPFESTGGEATHTLTVEELPSHNHSVNSSTYPDYQTWGLTQQEYGAKTSTTENTGGGQAHNNMPPYLAVNYWKRIA